MTASPSEVSTVSDVMNEYLEMIKLARSKQTMLTYRNALRVFREVLITKRLDPDKSSIDKLSEDFISSLAKVRGVQAGCDFAEAFGWLR